MPRRMRSLPLFSLLPSIAIFCPPLANAEHASIGGLVGSAAGEIVEGLFRYADDVIADEDGAFAWRRLPGASGSIPIPAPPSP